VADRDIERILKSYGIDERDLKSWHEIGITDPLEIKPWYSMEIASANVESARVAMFALVGRVDGGGVGVGVCS